MKKILLLSFLFPLISIVYAQKVIKVQKATDYSIHIFGDRFEGVIFTSKYTGGSLIKNNNPKITPTINDINLVEKLLKHNLDTIRNDNLFFRNSNLFIRKHLKKYLRQYFGYLNSKGQKVIYINCFWNQPRSRMQMDWLKYDMEVNDGGKNFWCIKINLTTRQSFDFNVNGIG